MSGRAAAQRKRSSGGEGDESLHDFLARELPPGATEQTVYVVKAVSAAGARYDRYNTHRDEWLDYAGRKRRLNSVAWLTEKLVLELCKLDILSRDRLVCPTEPKRLEALVGTLAFLNGEAAKMAGEIQDNGRPRDIAEQHWILEMADIYENSFGRPPTLSGSWNKPGGRFYRFLERGLPPSFLRYGKLSLRHVKRTLARRKKPIKIVLTIGGPVEQTPAPATDSASDHEPARPSQASP